MKKGKQKKLSISKFKIARIGRGISTIYGGTEGNTDGTETTSLIDRTSTDPDCNDTN